jgi:hypothetical protein
MAESGRRCLAGLGRVARVVILAAPVRAMAGSRKRSSRVCNLLAASETVGVAGQVDRPKPAPWSTGPLLTLRAECERRLPGQSGLRAVLAAKDRIMSESAVVASSNGGSPVSATLVRPR